mgnify:CR=1 FL=1
MKLTRRAFLWAALGGGAAVAVGASAWSWFRGDPEAIVLAVLRRRVGFLNPSDETLRTFASDYLISRESYRRTLARLSVLALPLRFASPYEVLPMGNPLRRLEDNMVSQFLLSTDFFETGANEDRTPDYVGFNDPAVRPCRNPFATRPDVG